MFSFFEILPSLDTCWYCKNYPYLPILIVIKLSSLLCMYFNILKLQRVGRAQIIYHQMEAGPGYIISSIGSVCLITSMPGSTFDLWTIYLTQFLDTCKIYGRWNSSNFCTLRYPRSNWHPCSKYENCKRSVGKLRNKFCSSNTPDWPKKAQ